METLSNLRIRTARVYTIEGVDLEESPAPTAGDEGEGLMQRPLVSLGGDAPDVAINPKCFKRT